jgi:hypothetical protein
MRAVLVALVFTSVGLAAPRPKPVDPVPSEIPAPVAYKDLMLVLVTKDGAAAVVFNNPAADGNGVEYSYRYESRDGKKKLEGTGKLFEQKLNGRDTYDPDGLAIVAGPVKVTWSRGGAERGWIYYAPELVTVHLAHANNFKERPSKFGDGRDVTEELDLRRFMRK